MRSFARDALEAAIRAVQALSGPLPAEAELLCRVAEPLLGRGPWPMPADAVALADAWRPLDALESARLLEVAPSERR